MRGLAKELSAGARALDVWAKKATRAERRLNQAGFQCVSMPPDQQKFSDSEMGTSEVAKKRILPPWMMTRVAEPVQKWTEVRRKRRKKVWPRTETIYCMNEAELVDAALCILAEKCKGREVGITSSEDEAQEPQQVVADPERTSVNGNDRAGAQSSGTGSKVPNNLEALACDKKTKSDEDDDALKYVREIFFT